VTSFRAVATIVTLLAIPQLRAEQAAEENAQGSWMVCGLLGCLG
jgi:hypothetical protein